MTFTKILITFVSAVMLFNLAGLGFAQEVQPNIEIYELRYESQFKTIEKLNLQKKELETFINQNSQKIESLKSKKEISYLERQRLDNLLKESQEYSRKINLISTELNQVNAENQITVHKLIQLYEQEINRNLKLLEDKTISQSEKNGYYKLVRKFQKRKDNIQTQIGKQSIENVRLIKLEISPEDTPKKIVQKADLLKDQEDKYRQLSQQYQTRKQELQKELKLRNRIDDLVTGLVLFDQQDEPMSALNDNQAKSENFLDANESSVSSPAWRGQDDFTVQENILINPKDFTFNSLSEGELEDIIEALQKRSQQSKARADSLAKQAEIFYKTAESLKKNQK